MELLRGMPDYLLKDIGISRGEIEQAARGRLEGLALSQIKVTSDDLSGIARRQRKPRVGSARRSGDTR